MSKPKRIRLSPEERKQQLLKAAIDLFAEKGIGEAKHADIARRVGVSTAATFVYFPTRDALLDSVALEIKRFALTLFEGLSPKKARGMKFCASCPRGCSTLRPHTPVM